MLWVLPGLIALAIFAIALTQIETSNAGRAYAAYGGIYILSAIIWLWTVEGVKPDRWDLLGVAVCLIGTGIIMAKIAQRAKNVQVRFKPLLAMLFS